MGKVKKIHKVILLFVLIFLLGIYSFSVYINNTIDNKKENVNESVIKGSGQFDKEAIKIN